MKNGVVNETKVIGILNRLRIAPESARRAIVQELIAAADEVREPGTVTNQLDSIAHLRGVLEWPEVRGNPLAVARIARALRTAREQQ